MAFEELFFKTDVEQDLLKNLIQFIQLNYFKLQNEYYFLKLEHVPDNKSQIIWAKAFSNMYELGDFYYDTILERLCILVKFEENRYELLVQGFSISDRFKVWPNKTEGHYPIEITWNREEKRMSSREILERGFGEIAGQLSLIKGNKAV